MAETSPAVWATPCTATEASTHWHSAISLGAVTARSEAAVLWSPLR